MCIQSNDIMEQCVCGAKKKNGVRMTSIEVRQASAVLYTDISMRVKSERVAHSESEREKQRARERGRPLRLNWV